MLWVVFVVLVGAAARTAANAAAAAEQAEEVARMQTELAASALRSAREARRRARANGQVQRVAVPVAAPCSPPPARRSYGCVELKDVKTVHGDVVAPAVLDECVGRGMTGAVFAAGDVAVKVSSCGGQQLVTDEAATYVRVGRVDGVVPLLSFGTANSGHHAWLAMPRLTPLPKALTDPQALVVGSRARAALLALHSKGVVHGDVSLQNMLYDGSDLSTVVLCDLAHYNAHEFGALLQRDNYRMPELRRRKTVDGVLARRSDLYALGCVLLQATTGIPSCRVPSQARLARRLEPATDAQRLIRALLSY